MKRYSILALGFMLCLSAMFSLSACRKYEDGPSLSFSSKESRVVNDWKAVGFARNDITEINDYENITMSFSEIAGDDEEDFGDFTWTTRLKNDTTDWSFSAKWQFATLKKQIKLSYTDSTLNEDRLLYMDILRLKKDEMWLNYQIETDYYHIRLVPNQ